MAADDFQSRMMKYIKYGLSIKTTEADGREYYLVGINFNPKWNIVQPSEESGVFCVPATDGEGMFYYFSEVHNGVNVIFDSIEETIQYNEDVEKKIKLLKEKISELQELFATETYEKLKNYQFTYTPPKKGKGKTNKKNILEEKKEEMPVIEDEKDKTMEENNVEVMEKDKPVEVGNNKEEASEIDAKIAALLGK